LLLSIWRGEIAVKGEVRSSQINTFCSFKSEVSGCLPNGTLLPMGPCQK
jgi:hypothetical protein